MFKGDLKQTIAGRIAPLGLIKRIPVTIYYYIMEAMYRYGVMFNVLSLFLNMYTYI